LVRGFAEAGYRFESVSYKEDDEYKRLLIEEFSKPDTKITGLIATDILTRGFDVTDVMIGVSARPFSKSFSSHVQQMGRVMRPHEGKEFGVWLDHSGNFLRFRPDWDRLYTEGVKTLDSSGEKTKKEPTEREKKEATCPKCKALWKLGSQTCIECGYERPLKQVITLPGQLQELAEANRKLQIDNRQFYAELMYYGKLKNYKDGWAAVKYKEKFGVYPHGIRVEPAPTSAKTMGWIKNRLIAYSKSKARLQS
jgi:DNA repair protein RadD